MNRYMIISYFLFWTVVGVMAQEKSGYYFKEFVSGRVVLKNQQFARGKFNYDFVRHQMHFLNGTTDMIVDDLERIDTIVVDTIRFIPFEKRFVEVIGNGNGRNTLLGERKSITRERGKKGAMGIATHGSVQAIDVNTRFQRVNGESNTDLHIYKEEVEMIYFLQDRTSGERVAKTVDDRLDKRQWKSFHNVATFLKLFPKNSQSAVHEYIKSAATDFSSPHSVLQLLDVLEKAGY